MKDINILFFELIRVAIGSQKKLSRQPKTGEWDELYKMALKQSLVGVCFAALPKLGADADEGFARIGMSEMLYLTWMGMAAKIQQRNIRVNKRCAELQERLSADGFRSSILKGQGVARLYGEQLWSLRQSGDIDIWLEGGWDAAMQLIEKLGIKPVVAEHHIDLPVMSDVDVEIHYTPSYLRCPWYNRRLQAWFKEQETTQFANRNEDGWCVPTTEFNLVFLMLHTFRHLTSEGVGLRQIMDYYFALRSATSIDKQQAYSILCKLGIKRFCGAMMYVLSEVYGMNSDELLCPINSHEGEYLLNEIMTGGNFGHHDERVKKSVDEGKWSRFVRQTKRNIHQLSHYPAEALFSPWWRAKVWIWRKWNGWI